MYVEFSDDDTSSIVVMQDTTLSNSTQLKPSVPDVQSSQTKLTLSDLEEVDQSTSSSVPQSAQKRASPNPSSENSSSVRSTSADQTPKRLSSTSPSSIKPGISTRKSKAGLSSSLDGSLSSHLAAHRPPKSTGTSGGSVNSGNSGSFAPQPRRLPDVSTSTTVALSDSQVSPDISKQRQNSAPWSISKRIHSDTLSSPSGKSVSTTAEEHQVTVAVRIRPFMVGEIQQGPRRVVSVNGDKLILVNPNAFDADPDTIAAAAAAVSLENMRCNDWAKVFCFDHCLWSYDPTDKEDIYVDEEGIYEAVGSNIVNDVTRGISSCCFAYGHTGTGKTHTMLGYGKDGSFISANDIHGMRLVDSAGLAPRVFMDVIEEILNDPDVAKDTRITVSFLEIYQEKLRDCLVPSGNVGADLKVREHPALGPYVENLRKVEVKSPQQALALLYEGYCERSTGQNNRNRLSSRSHAVITLELTAANAPDPFIKTPSSSKHSQPSPVHRQEHVRLQMVDLAGSEKESTEEKSDDFTVKKGTMTPRKGANFSDSSVEKLELKMIRRSLSTLGYIIKALGSGMKTKGLPFRDSLLTWLLKDSFMRKSNTTMIATISPSHTCFDETLSTLKYAERLCNLSPSSMPGHESSGRVSIRDTIDPQLSYTLATEFSRLKRELGGGKQGSLAARHLLQQTVSDPQQRLARMNPYIADEVDDDGNVIVPQFNNDVNVSSSQVIDDLRQPLPKQEINFANNNNHKNTYNKNDPSNSIGDRDLKEAYRQLHGKYVELQIELENARTDRDGMQLEMQHLQESLNRANADRYADSQSSELSELAEALRNAEGEASELRGVVLRKEEAVDRLVSELAEERKARDIIEQTARAQVTELIKRLEGLHKQGQEALQKSDTWQSAAETLQAEKENLNAEVTLLRGQLDDNKRESTTKYETINKELQLSVKQYSAVVEERDKLQAEIAGYSNEKAQLALRESSLSQRVQELEVSLEKATNDSKVKSELEVVKLQRDSLYEIINQQEKQIQVQQQQAESSLKMLHQRQEALDRYEQKTGGDMDELMSLQNSLHKMLTNEGELLHSELIDARRMTEVISTVKGKVQEAKLLKEEVSRIQSDNVQLRESVDRLSQENKSTVDTIKTLNDKVSQYKKNAIDWETRANYWQQTAQKNATSRSTDSGGEGAALDNLDNAKLQELLQISQKETADAKAELEASKDDMEKEFSSLWLAVEQLNKLDASKDKALADMTAKYDEACQKNTLWEEKYKAIVQDYDKLQRELQVLTNMIYDVHAYIYY